MANDKVKIDSQNVSENTSAADTSPLVSTHIAGTKVKIDPAALRHLVETLRRKLKS